jgi:hypothetical protein
MIGIYPVVKGDGLSVIGYAQKFLCKMRHGTIDRWALNGGVRHKAWDAPFDHACFKAGPVIDAGREAGGNTFKVIGDKIATVTVVFE